MLVAAAWGGVAASSLLVGMIIGLRWSPPQRLLGLVLGFGAGALFAAIAFDLVDGALDHGGEWTASIGMLFGALVYVGGSRALRSNSGNASDDDSLAGDSRSIVLGATLDGIPESMAIGSSVWLAGAGAVSLTLPVAVALSNLPEALGATVGMRHSGVPTRHIVATWTWLVLASAAASTIGYAVLSHLDERIGSVLDASTAGAVLAMVADTMTPDAYKAVGRAAGLATVLGFAVSLLLS